MSFSRRSAAFLSLSLASAAFALTSVAASQNALPRPLPRVVQRIDNTARVVLHGNIHPLANAANDRGLAPADLPAGRMLLLLQRSAQQEAELQTYLRAVQDPNSPQYRQWLTPEEFGHRFGISDSDLTQVQQWLVQQGFTVNRVSAGRLTIEFSGTFGQVENAFQTSIHKYVVNGEQHWANASDPQIPKALSPVVAGIVSLNNFTPKSMAVRGPSGTFKPESQQIQPQLTQGDTTNGYTLYVGPADAATIYNTPTQLNPSHSGTTYDGSGVTIGIAGDSNIDVQQNANYRATFGLPAKATQVVVDGADPGENGDAIEAYLDTQVAGGIAPGANVVLYTASDTYLNAGLFLAILRAVDSNSVDILNVSFGGCEQAQGAAGNQYIYDVWQQAAAQGISVTVSSGDSGSAGCDSFQSTYARYGFAVNALASTPYNVAVGGTDFDTLYSNFPTSFTKYADVTNSKANHRSALSYIPEEPWNDSTVQGYNGKLIDNIPWAYTNYSSLQNIVAAGGGASACVTGSGGACGGGYPVPTWQSSFATDKTGRNVPDISLLAGNGLYGATWALCTDQDYISATQTQPDCVGTPTAGGNFNVTGVGGTSASAPAFAGILALAVQKTGGRVGQADYVLYKLAKTKYATVFHDLTVGNNSVSCTYGTPNCITAGKGSSFLSGFDTLTGYDEASGLGSVDSSQLVNNWASASATATTSNLTLNGGTSPLTITHGDAVSVNIDVTGSGGTPSGPVALVDNIDPAKLPDSGAIGTYALASGSASGTVHNLPGGSYKVSSHYGGDQTFAASDSNAIAVTVNPENSTTSLKVRGYYDPSTGQSSSTPYYGFIYLLDAQPYGSSSTLSNPDGTATGSVTFTSGSTNIGAATIGSDGIAELQTGSIPGGANSLKASYAGDASFNASTSDPVSLTVQPSPSFLTLTSDKDPYSYNAGDPVTITSVFSSNAGTKYLDSVGAAPTGTVTFSVDGKQVGTATVSGTAGSAISLAAASANFTAKNLAWGGHNISAAYSGDANYASSVSTSYLYVYLTGAVTKMTLAPASNSIKVNQSVLLTASLPASGSLPAPTGTVTFSAVNSSYATVWTSSAIAASSGSASATIPANTLPIGSFTLMANYSGDADYSGNSTTAALQVNSSGTVPPTLALTMPSSPVNGAVPITLKVTGPNGDATPTGSVTVGGSNNTWSLTGGSVSLTFYGSFQPGSNTLTVNYLGDSTYAGASTTGTFIEMAPANISTTPNNPTVYVGDSLKLTVSVAAATGLPQPTGTITLSSGSYTSDASALASGSASITIPANTLAAGSDVVGISYSGDANYVAGNSSILVQVSSTPPGFSLTSDSVSLSAGQSHTANITLTPAGGFTGQVALTAQITSAPANAVNQPTFSFGTTSPINVTSPNQPFTASITVSTTGSTSAAMHKPARPGMGMLGAGGSALACLLLLINPKRRRWQQWLGMVALSLALSGGLAACGSSGGSSGGGGSQGTTPGAYTVTITGTSGSLTANTTMTVLVN